MEKERKRGELGGKKKRNKNEKEKENDLELDTEKPILLSSEVTSISLPFLFHFEHIIENHV